jgi:2-polyprenyl-3-methyl-5-hydroxy-6-metoxy-1,4-benzoquinol methylase
MNDVKVANFADVLGISYNDALNIIVDRFIDEFNCDPPMDGDVFDLSCPHGRLNESLERLGLPVVGIDFSFHN